MKSLPGEGMLVLDEIIFIFHSLARLDFSLLLLFYSILCKIFLKSDITCIILLCISL